MHVLLTTCTARKHPDPAPMPAVQRYRDPRIEHARTLAHDAGLPLYILSGVYGLLAAGDVVPWYDHALQPEEVPAGAHVLACALEAAGITRITAVLEHRNTPGWAPYHAVLEQGCAPASVTLEVRLWSPPATPG